MPSSYGHCGTAPHICNISATCTGCFTTAEGAPSTHWLGSVGFIACVDTGVVERKISVPV